MTRIYEREPDEDPRHLCVLERCSQDEWPETRGSTDAYVRGALGLWLCGRCGHADGFDTDDTGASKIIGGRRARIKDHPYMAIVWGERADGPYCGGVILSDTWIATAAHCVNKLDDDHHDVLVRGKPVPGDTSEYAVVVGTDENPDWVYGSKNWRAPKRTRIESIVLHPDNKGDNELGNSAFDIALLKLEKPLTMGDHVAAIELASPDKESDSYAGSDAGLTAPNLRAIITGFGEDGRITKLEEDRAGGEVGSPFLKRISMRIWPEKDTKDEYKANHWHLDSKVEFVASSGGGNTCGTDSGGPLVVRAESEGKSRDVLVGISLFSECAKPGSFTSFTRISGVRSWIDKTMK